MIKSFYFLVLISILYLLLYIGSVNAQTMSNSRYTIQMGNLNSFAGKPSNSSYKVSFTGGQSGANLFTGPNYKVKLGFQYIYPFIPFRFTINTIFINFGTISPTTPVLRTNQLTISNRSAHGYQVTASQNHNLRVNTSGQEIPATSCDSGTCTPTTAAAWTSALSYGFGYRCDNVSGSDCDSQFTTSNYYKPFISSPSAVTVMSSLNTGQNRKVNITYKVNIPQTQPAGIYTNILNYIAMPTY